MKLSRTVFLLTLAVLAGAALYISVGAQQKKPADSPKQTGESKMFDCPMMKENHADCPMMQKPDSGQMNSMAQMNKRGEQAMGFSQTATTHHFRLFRDGGAIEVIANDANDKTSVGNIRMHLQHIAMQFSEGNFSTPFAVHHEMPSGVAAMKETRSAITFKYEERESGGRVRITTSDAKALAAVYDFLRYQIKEHATGNMTEVQEDK